VALYEALTEPLALCARGVWATTNANEKQLANFERKIFRRIIKRKRPRKLRGKNNPGKWKNCMEKQLPSESPQK